MKIDRTLVLKKYPNGFVMNEGKCGYCGDCITLEAMQIDHIRPKHLGGTDDFENLMPTCRVCNNWKSVFSIEDFRRQISLQIERLNRWTASFRMAKRYGLIQETPKEIKFYFETRQP